MHNPYSREYAASLLYAGKRLFAIEPSDSERLPRTIKRLRVLNSLDAVAFVRVEMLGGDILTIPFPPGVSYEDGQIVAVKLTGTTSGLYLHGYSDGGDPIVEVIDDGQPINLDFDEEDNSGLLGAL